MSEDETVNTAIAAYLAKAQLEDLTEIEDHLRTLTAELRATGMPAVAAVTEASRRLGDPHAITREHARVRTPFGAPLSRWRAHGVALLLVPALGYLAIEAITGTGLWSLLGLALAGLTLVGIAVVLRPPWIRPVLLGALGFSVLQTFANPQPLMVLWPLCALALFAPWRPGELSRGGAALALLVWANFAVTYGMAVQTFTAGTSTWASAPFDVAFVAAIVATCGSALRARWSALAAACSSLALAGASIAMWSAFHGRRAFEVGDDSLFLLLSVVLGAVASATAALLARPAARPRAATA